METIAQFLRFLYGSFFVFAGVMHFVKMDFFKHFIPNYLPKKLVNYVIGVIEFSLGLGLFTSSFIKEASIGIIVLLIILLPIHIWDLTKTKPAIGSKKLAVIRIPFQFLLMYGIYFVYIHA